MHVLLPPWKCWYTWCPLYFILLLHMVCRALQSTRNTEVSHTLFVHWSSTTQDLWLKRASLMSTEELFVPLTINTKSSQLQDHTQKCTHKYKICIFYTVSNAFHYRLMYLVCILQYKNRKMVNDKNYVIWTPSTQDLPACVNHTLSLAGQPKTV